MPVDLAELRQRIEYAVAGIDHQMLVRGSMSAESPTVGIWKTCKVCTETLRDTLSSGTIYIYIFFFFEVLPFEEVL